MKIATCCRPTFQTRLISLLHTIGLQQVQEFNIRPDHDGEAFSLVFIDDRKNWEYWLQQYSVGQVQFIIWVYFAEQIIPDNFERINYFIDGMAQDFILTKQLTLLVDYLGAMTDLQGAVPLVKNLKLLTDQSLLHMQKLKKLNEKIVPLRHEQLGPVTIHFKYGAGASRGGDFYDVVEKKDKIYLFLFNTKSYLVSSSIMSMISQWSQRPFDDDFSNLLTKMASEVLSFRSGSEDSSVKVECLCLNINLKNLTFAGHLFGNIRCILNETSTGPVSNALPFESPFFASAFIQGTLLPNSAWAIFSPGVANNMGGDFGQLLDWAKNSLGMNGRDFCNEVFISMSRTKEGDFYQNDASVLFIKVEKNALSEI